MLHANAFAKGDNRAGGKMYFSHAAEVRVLADELSEKSRLDEEMTQMPSSSLRMR